MPPHSASITKGQTMQKIDHAEILAAYISRLTLADLEAITASNRVWTHAALNYGNNAQDSARAGFYAAVSNSIRNLMPHDIERIEETLDRNILQIQGAE
jgi:propanediol dehydratase large subunit